MGATGRVLHFPSETTDLTVNCKTCDYFVRTAEAIRVARAHVRANPSHRVIVLRITESAVVWDE